MFRFSFFADDFSRSIAVVKDLQEDASNSVISRLATALRSARGTAAEDFSTNADAGIEYVCFSSLNA